MILEGGQVGVSASVCRGGGSVVGWRRLDVMVICIILRLIGVNTLFSTGVTVIVALSLSL